MNLFYSKCYFIQNKPSYHYKWRDPYYHVLAYFFFALSSMGNIFELFVRERLFYNLKRWLL